MTECVNSGYILYVDMDIISMVQYGLCDVFQLSRNIFTNEYLSLFLLCTELGLGCGYTGDRETANLGVSKAQRYLCIRLMSTINLLVYTMCEQT